MGPACKEDVERGLDHVLSLTDARRKEILSLYFVLAAGVYKMNSTATMAEFWRLMILEQEQVAGMQEEDE